ncbi:MAG: hypothetical protein NTV88_01775 [Candidatus Micrarchaeota archaeon]|nr:hypothetical protein [Candidatus Micrarchaeota archaeon]
MALIVDFFLNKVASDPKKGEVGLEIMILKAIENMEDLSPENLAEVKSRLAKDKSRIRAMGSKGSKLERKDPGDGIDAGVNARFGMNGFDLAGYINKIIIPKINAIISIAMGKQVESKTAPESPHGASFFTEARRAQSVVNEELALKPTRDKITKARKKQLDENDDHSNVS